MKILPPTKCVIVDPYTGERLTLQLAPNTISQNKGIDVDSTRIPGASQPKVSSSSGTSNIIGFTTSFFAESEEFDTVWVRKQIAWLLSLTNTRVVNEFLGIRKVTPVFLMLGSLIGLPVYLSRVDASYGPFEDDNLMPLLATAKLDFVEVVDPEEFVSAVAARNNGYLQSRPWTVVNELGESLGTYL